jgi:glycosyltransferase involved in cell wall biosynthesis
LHASKVKKLTLLCKPGTYNLMQKAIVAVTNDLTTDQRVHRTCMALSKAGYEVLLVGRQRKNSLPLAARPYGMHRMKLSFDKGPVFYANYNLRLFLLLMMRHTDLIVSNDLDTMAGCYPAWRLKKLFGGKANLLHDCHEYFRGVPELVGRKLTTRIWKVIEDHTFPELKAVIAVNRSVAGLYEQEYKLKVTVIRNVPFRREQQPPADKSKYGIGADQKVILYQGAVNVDRGLEEAIQAMKFLRTDAKLVIAGTGDVFDKIRQFATDQKVSGKVVFLGQVPFQELHTITLMADLGLSIEKDVSLNYHYALPNKFMDYIQAGVPVLISPFPEMKAVVDKYFIGETIENHDPAYLAARFDAMLMNPGRMEVYRQNLVRAAEDLCWENEEKTLMELLADFKAS